MNKITKEKQVQVIASLVEGNSIRSTVRMTGVAKGTILKFLADIGKVCTEYQDKAFRNLKCKKIQCDEIWSFCYAKEQNVPEEMQGQFGFGDVWTWTALDADTKLVPCWRIGKRNTCNAKLFIADLAKRLANRVQLTTDGHRPYLTAVEEAFGGEIDYSQLIKIYGPIPKDEKLRYSSGQCCGVEKANITGNPDPKAISTSFVERQNLNMRMSMRRFTRLTNGFSKKVENLSHAVALYFMYYNFCRIHQTLRVTPAIESKVTDHVWEIEEILALMPQAECNKRGPYKKRNSN